MLLYYLLPQISHLPSTEPSKHLVWSCKKEDAMLDWRHADDQLWLGPITDNVTNDNSPPPHSQHHNIFIIIRPLPSHKYISTKGTTLHGQVEEMKEVFGYECPISFPPHPFFQIFFLPINIFSHFPCSDHQSHRVNLTKYNIECALELSTHLHEVSQPSWALGPSFMIMIIGLTSKFHV